MFVLGILIMGEVKFVNSKCVGTTNLTLCSLPLEYEGFI